jgi:hypothetical protein
MKLNVVEKKLFKTNIPLSFEIFDRFSKGTD